MNHHELLDILTGFIVYPTLHTTLYCLYKVPDSLGLHSISLLSETDSRPLTSERIIYIQSDSLYFGRQPM